MRAVLALDQGSHASRACVFDQHGHLLAQRHLPVATQHEGGHIEQDPLALVQSLRTVAQQALVEARLRHPQLEVQAAGLAVQRSTIVCCRRERLAALTPAISWQDRRHAAWLATLAPSATRVRALTGLPLSPHYGASKLRWCLDEVPAVRAAAQAGELLALPLAAYLAARLTGGEPLVDAANASRTLLFDTAAMAWSDELLALFGIPAACLPRCVPTGSHYGELALEGQALPLTALTGDQSAVPFASGTLDLDSVSVNLGTGAFVQQPLAARPGSPAPLLGSVLGQFAGGARYTLEGTVNGGGSAVAAFIAAQGCNEAQLWAALDALDVLELARCPLYLNGHGGLGSPWWQARFDSRWLHDGADAGANAGANDTLARFAALVESIAFMVAVNVAELARHGAAPGALRLTGGMSRSAFLRERLAAFCELPVWSGEPEASARGVAALARPDWGQAWRAAQQSGGTHAGSLLACTPPPEGALRLLAQGRHARLAEAYAEALSAASQRAN
jgi:glycerol kinase